MFYVRCYSAFMEEVKMLCSCYWLHYRSYSIRYTDIQSPASVFFLSSYWAKTPLHWHVWSLCYLWYTNSKTTFSLFVYLFVYLFFISWRIYKSPEHWFLHFLLCHDNTKVLLSYISHQPQHIIHFKYSHLCPVSPWWALLYRFLCFMVL